MGGKEELEAYLKEKGVDRIMQHLVDAVSVEKPEDVRSFLVRALQKEAVGGESPAKEMPKWEDPGMKFGYERWTGLRLLNSFTKTKTPFIPASQDGKKVKWYICGPTVYDSAHVGHARNYVAFDIARRILSDYFHYDVQYVMNITDLDDKIIMRSHRKHLEKMLTIAENGLAAYVEKKRTVDEIIPLVQAIAMGRAVVQYEEKNIPLMMDATKGLCEATRKDVFAAVVPGCTVKECDIQSEYLKLANTYEKEFFEDMSLLGMRAPDAVTRVSEYMPDIVSYIQQIIDNGFAYESNGSVYFNVSDFQQSGLCYGKLDPTKVGSSELIAEGEGALSAAAGDKRSSSDFALWKASKRGEPAWDSPWGKGRPGWHIECSCMCSSILGHEVDINCGGVDLKFPHHDNQLAQSEAYYGVKQWVNYFLHSGHLHIKGLKMSKSLKNFVTIRGALEKYTARQIRMLFVVNPYYVPMDFSDDSMSQALTAEKKLNECFLSLKGVLREQEKVKSQGRLEYLQVESFQEDELALLNELSIAKSGVDDALCDALNTKSAIERLLQLVSATNSYMQKRGKESRAPLLTNVGIFMTQILNVFGFGTDDIGFTSGTASAASVEQVAAPYLDVLSSFRDNIRAKARTNKDGDVLQLCDALRDDILPELGVRLEDKGDGSVWKLDDKETLLKEREIKAQEAEEKRRAKEARLEQQRLKKEAEAKRLQVSPKELFLPSFDELFGRKDGYQGYKLNDEGLPIEDAEGKEVSKKLAKKLQKEMEKHIEARKKAGIE